MKKYIVVNGTSFSENTTPRVAQLLNELRDSQVRITLDYGEVYDISGRIGRSTGTSKIPLLIHNSRSLGGGAILDDCIIGIKESRGGRVLYKLDLSKQ